MGTAGMSAATGVPPLQSYQGQARDDQVGHVEIGERAVRPRHIKSRRDVDGAGHVGDRGRSILGGLTRAIHGVVESGMMGSSGMAAASGMAMASGTSSVSGMAAASGMASELGMAAASGNRHGGGIVHVGGLGMAVAS
ncbi:hypothetical protein PHYSODRAFT_264492 [Phytophthora sojae]|uniref:Uncharacterized protein n=1 Tax=Phytophthora sojae (strain P6497) TaxID=1094619 RepID=G4Z349_PHYSP|nr:hypothetical protein PHYSODRAFT_264492 [Phytophthora sojae]EGZ20078.1 hypothetical protein PHYSODRAFT_264492 [Phytophthora sojae]|eukprot:XP_009522795.1 hypothetical protein PHYSODRAFT_264492 [Phytophthora sojae]